MLLSLAKSSTLSSDRKGAKDAKFFLIPTFAGPWSANPAIDGCVNLRYNMRRIPKTGRFQVQASWRKAFEDRVQEEPFARKLGLRLLDIDYGYAKVEMALSPDLRNIHGTIHGGVIFSLIDEAFELACNAHGTVAVALSMNIVYLSPPRGENLTAEAREFHRTRKTSHYDIQVVDELGTPVAACRALAYRKAERLPFLDDQAG
jgi:acyl-CoA thioesterase